MTKQFYIFFLLLTGVLYAQPQEVLFLRQLQIETLPARDFPTDKLRRQYETRPYSPQLLKEIKEQSLAQIRESGYYFAALDSSKVTIDSTSRTATVYLRYYNGKRVVLQGVVISGDSLSAAKQTRLAAEANNYSGQIYNTKLSERLVADLLRIMEDDGYPLARLTTADFTLSDTEKDIQLTLEISAQPGDSVQLSYLKFPKRPQDITPYLQRLLNFKPGQTYSQKRIINYRRILQRQEFIKSAQAPVLSRDKDGAYFLRIDFDESPSTTLDGVVGYIPPPSNQPEASGYFTGLLNIGVRNLFGGGRKFRIFWEKEDELSDAFQLNYREPFVLGLPLHTAIGLQRVVRDTTYIEWQYHLDLEVPINETLSGFLNFSTRSVAPDSLASRKLRLPITESIITESGIRWDTRNERLNPQSGINMEIAFSLSSQDNTGPAYLLAEDSLRSSVTLRRVRADIHTFLPTFKRQVFANRLHLQFLESSGSELQLTDQFWFGGATTIRGFRESQFSAKRAFWINSEYRFLLSPEARFFVFSDNGYYSRTSPDIREDWLSSYGIGLRFGAPLGIVQVDFGLERGTPFREGKLHFRLINEF
ncbi:MAG: BamA/TamA family outer membrane protein [Calditrichia bacterium]